MAQMHFRCICNVALEHREIDKPREPGEYVTSGNSGLGYSTIDAL